MKLGGTNMLVCPLAAQAKKIPKAVFLRESGREISFLEADTAVRRLVSVLRARGVDRGHCLAILSPNSVSYALMLFALQRIGAVAAPLSLRLNEESWRAQVKAADASYIAVDDTAKHTWGLALSLHELGEEALSMQPSIEDDIDDNPLFDNQEATVIFTSGSTGAGKGVVLTVGNHRASAQQSNEITGLSPGDCWLLSLPLFHVGGLGILYRACFAGASVYISGQSFSGEALLRHITSAGATHLSLVPTVLEECLSLPEGAETLNRLKAILLGGAPSSPGLLLRAHAAGLRLLSSYGMTETTSHCTASRIGDPPEKLITSGRPLRHIRIALFDVAGCESEPGRPGEIAVSGPTIFRRYLHDEKERADGSWFFTGDLGTIDREGYLNVTGRKDRMFISGGENIDPAEIEAAARSFPSVTECAVFAVPDAKWGKRPVLAIEGSLDDDRMAALRSHLEAALPRMKRPDKIVMLTPFPRRGIGKVDYLALEELVLGSVPGVS